MANIKRITYAATVLLCIMALIGCDNKATGIASNSNETKTSTDMPGKDNVVESKETATLTDADLALIDEINAESNLFCKLYEDMGREDRQLVILAGEKSDAHIFKIPDENASYRVKEIDIRDEGYTLLGMEIGTSREEFEQKMTEKGFEVEPVDADATYGSFTKGNVYVAAYYDKDRKVTRIFVNLLVDYVEWRGIE